MPIADFRRFTFQDDNVVVDFLPDPTVASPQHTFPPLWNRKAEFTLLESQAVCTFLGISVSILLIQSQKLFGQLLIPLLEAKREHETKTDLIRRARQVDVQDICGMPYHLH